MQQPTEQTLPKTAEGVLSQTWSMQMGDTEAQQPGAPTPAKAHIWAQSRLP